jgi:hypothetical protein
MEAAAIQTIDTTRQDYPIALPKQNRAECYQRNRNDCMPTTSRLTNEMIEAAILGSEEQKRRIDVQIAELRAMLSGAPASAPVEAANVIPPARPRRKVSAAGRKAMALAQKKRWAAKKKTASEPEEIAASKAVPAPKTKRKLSAAGKKRIIEASKRYWAAKKAAAKQSS